MALTVREQKAGNRPTGGYMHTLPTRAFSGVLLAPGTEAGGTVIHPAKLVPGPRVTGQLKGKRVSAPRRPYDQLKQERRRLIV